MGPNTLRKKRAQRKIYKKFDEKSMQIWHRTRKGKNRTQIGFGRVLDSIWEGFGTVQALFWALLGAFGSFFWCSKSCFVPAWAQDGVQEAFWIDFGSISEGSGRILRGFLEGLQGLWIDFGRSWERFWKCLACFGPAGAYSLRWTPALIREASQCAGVPTPQRARRF